jgi:hypothetical protein
MNVGMLWFDNDNKSDLLAKVNRAATYYNEKYGKRPNLCFIHPSAANKNHDPDAGKETFKVGEIEIRLTKSVLPNHFWIGVHNFNASQMT